MMALKVERHPSIKRSCVFECLCTKFNATITLRLYISENWNAIL